MRHTFLFAALVAGLLFTPARALDEGLGVSVGDIAVAGRIEGSSFSFCVDMDVTAARAEADLPLVYGDVVLEDVTEPKTDYLMKYDAEKYTYSIVLAKAGNQKLAASFAARANPIGNGEWREAAFDLPNARMRSIAITCDRADLEVQLPGAVRVERKVADDKLTITALLAPGVPMRVRWKPQVQQLDAKLVFASEANTIAAVSVGMLKLDAFFDFQISQGTLTDLTFNVPSNLSITQVRGGFIREWSVKKTDAANPQGPATLTVSLNRPQTSRYGIQILGESVLPSFPTQATVPVIEPQGGIRAGGTIAIGTSSAIQLVVKQSAGLSQINGAAFPRFVLNREEPRPLPSAKAFFFTHATTPYQMAIDLADIVPTVESMQTIVINVSEDDLTVVGATSLEVRDAPIRDMVLHVPSGLVVSDVSGQYVSDASPRPVVAGQATRAVDVRFSQPVQGRTVVNYRLELGRGPLATAQAINGIQVQGARIKRSFVVIAVDQGVALDAPQAQNLTDMNTSGVPIRVPNAQFAYSFREVDWSIQFTPRKKPATMRVESFELITLGTGLAYGNVALNYHITGSPVDEFSFHIPADLKNAEFVGQDVRSLSRDAADPTLYRLSLKRKVIGDYTLGMTFMLPYKDGDVISIGGIQAAGQQVQTQTGYVAVASHLNLKVETQITTGSELRAIEHEELPGAYGLLVNAPLLNTFTFIKTPHHQKVKITAYDRVDLLPVVIEVTDIQTEIFASEDTATQSRTQVRYKVKNSSNQFLPLRMPAGLKAWRAKVFILDKKGQLVEPPDRQGPSYDKANNLLMIPLPRNANPNEPITVVVEFGKDHGELGWAGAIELQTPSTDPRNQVKSTYTSWQIKAPAEWGVTVTGASNLIEQPRERHHGNLGAVMSSVGESWGWAWTRWLGAFGDRDSGSGNGVIVLLTIFVVVTAAGFVAWCAVKRPAATPLVLWCVGLLALLLFGILAANAPPLSSQSLSADDLSEVTLTQTVTMNAADTLGIKASVTPQWRQHVTLWGGIIVPILSFALIVLAFIRPGAKRYRLALIAAGLTGLLFGAAQYTALVPFMLHLFTWVLPLVLYAYFAWRTAVRPMMDIDSPSGKGAVAAAMIALFLLMPSQARAVDGVLAIAPKQPVLERVEANLKAEGDHMEVELKLKVRALDSARFVLMDQAPIILTPDDPNAALRIEVEGRRYVLVVSKAGVHEATFKFLSPMAKAAEDQSRFFGFPLPVALTNRVSMTIPTGGLDVYVDKAMRMTKEEKEGLTTVNAILGPGDDIAATWRPRARETALEKTVFYSQVTTAARFDASLIEARHLVKFTISQGELREIRLRIPEPMTVTAVQGRALGAWRFDPAKQELEVRLSEPAVGEYALGVVTQISQEKLPYEATLGPVIVQDAVRHVGVMGILVSPAVQVTVSKSPQAMNIDDFLREAAGLLQTVPGFTPDGTGGVRFAYRTAKAEDIVTAQAVEVKPEIRAHLCDQRPEEAARLVITSERLTLTGGVLIDVSKAGVFNVALTFPAAYQVETLTSPAISHWDDTVENGVRTVTIHFREKLLGLASIKFELSQQITTLPNPIVVPRLEVVGVLKHSGQFIALPEPGIRLEVAQRDGVKEVNPLEYNERRPGALAFNLLKPDWSLSLGAEVIEPRVTVDVLHIAKVSEGIVRHTHIMQYSLHNAGTKAFDLQVPKGAEGLQILGAAIARRIEVDKAAGRHRVELNRKWYDPTYRLTVEYYTKYTLPTDKGSTAGATGAIVIDPVKAIGADQQRGHVVVLTTDRVQLGVVSRSPALQKAEPRTISGGFGVRNLASAAFCYSTATPDYALTLGAQRHEAADLLQADVLRTRLYTVVADTGSTITRVIMDLRVGSKQHLEAYLPQGGEIWSLLVSGRSTVPSKMKDAKTGGQVLLIPLGAAATTSSDVRLDFVYVTPATGDWSTTQAKLEGPRFDLPLKNVTWQMFVPEQFKYDDFAGTLRVTQEVVDEVRIERYGTAEYDQQVTNFNRSNQLIAADADAAGDRLLSEGRGKQAQRAFEAAVHYSAFSEDSRVKLHQFNSNKALVGLVGSRLRLRQQTDGAGLGAVEELDLNTEVIGRVKSSLPKADSENLEAQTKVWTDIQEKAAGDTVQLAVNLPVRGRLLEFTRTVQVNAQENMFVQFQTKPQEGPASSSTRWSLAGVFIAIVLVMLLIPALRRAWPRLPDVLAAESGVADDAVDMVPDEDENEA
ncbi:MAG: hypothetical protein WD768_16315 [Phycisphaeraceae bacterium]